MRKLFFTAIYMLLLCTPLQAQTLYVDDIRRITFRTGPGIAHKVIDSLESGAKVEVIKQEGGWSQVRLADGKVGWILSRYLTDTPPTRLQLARMKAQHESLNEQVESLKQENQELADQNQRLTEELSEKDAQLAALRESYSELESNCAEYQKDKSMYDTSQLKVKQYRARMESLRTEVESLRQNTDYYWFLGGAGVLLAGIILGAIFGRRRQPKRFLS